VVVLTADVPTQHLVVRYDGADLTPRREVEVRLRTDHVFSPLDSRGTTDSRQLGVLVSRLGVTLMPPGVDGARRLLRDLREPADGSMAVLLGEGTRVTRQRAILATPQRFRFVSPTCPAGQVMAFR